MLSQLNIENGSFAFEHLARDLIHAEYCRNIKPATGPSSAGDRGEDSSTHPNYILDSDEELSIYSGTAPRTDDRLIFAFSIREDWRPKLRADIERIISSGLQPNRIVFATNQFIQTGARQDAERDVGGEFSIPVEILDGSWFLLYLEDEHYELAVKYLGCDPRPDRQIEEMYRRVLGLEYEGLSVQDRDLVEEIEGRVRYRTAYARPEHLVADLQELGEINAKYFDLLDESFRWFEEALMEGRSQNANTRVLLDAYYSYFRALFRLPAQHETIFQMLPEYRRLVLETNLLSYFSKVNIWQFFLMPGNRDDPEFRSFASDTLDHFVEYPSSGLSPLGRAFVLEATIDAELVLQLLDQVSDFSDHFAKLGELIDLVEDVDLYYRQVLAQKVAILSPAFSSDPEYEQLYDRAEELAVESAGQSERGLVRRSRGMAHFDSGDVIGAIEHFEKCRFLWTDYDDIRGKVMASMMIGYCHARIGNSFASEWAHLHAIQIGTAVEDSMQLDLVSSAFGQLHNSALVDGRLLTAIDYARFYLNTAHAWERDATDAEEFVEALAHNITLILSRLFSENRRLHDRAFERVFEFIPDYLFPYSELVTKNLEELQSEYKDSDELTALIDMFNSLRDGSLPALENRIRDETAPFVMIDFENQFLSVELIHQNTRDARIVAYTLASILQHLFTSSYRELVKLDWLEDHLRAHIAISEYSSERPVLIEQIPNSNLLELRLTVAQNAIASFTTAPYSNYPEFTMGTWLELVDRCVLNPQDDLNAAVESLTSQGLIEMFSHIPPIGSLIVNFPGENFLTVNHE